MQRFWDKVNKTEICWEWKGHVGTKGYGGFGMQINRKTRCFAAHRISWELHYGKIPEGLWVLHKCDNRKCVRPDHLWLGTVVENQADMKSKGRSRNGCRPGEGSQHHKLTNEKVLQIRQKFADGIDKKSLAKEFDVTITSIRYIVTRKQWSHI